MSWRGGVGGMDVWGMQSMRSASQWKSAQVKFQWNYLATPMRWFNFAGSAHRWFQKMLKTRLTFNNSFIHSFNVVLCHTANNADRHNWPSRQARVTGTVRALHCVSTYREREKSVSSTWSSSGPCYFIGFM